MIGRQISHYKILKKIGAGGMGKVYLAEDTKLERKVALKFLPLDLTRNKESNKRFKREAKAAAALNHPNIVTIHEINEHDVQTYIAMEYIEGQDLKEKITLHKNGLDALDTVSIALQICEGLYEAHQSGIIHRDIKPANIIIDLRGRAKLLDFGLAKLTDQSHTTHEESTGGTIQYMSPEQVSGDNVDQRSDIWSLGVVLYEAITGQLPFTGEYAPAVMYSIINEDPQPVDSLNKKVPQELAEIIHRCLQKEADKRFGSMADIIALLRPLLKAMDSGKQPILLIKRGFKPTLSRWLRKRRVAKIAILVVLLFFIVPNPGRKALKEWLFAGKLPEKKSLVVLPLLHSSPDANHQAYALGTTARIISKLNDLEQYQTNLWAAPIQELQRYKIKDVEKAGEYYSINLILSGSVELDGVTVIHKLVLVNAKSQSPLKKVILTNHISNLSELQDGIIKKLLEMLDVGVSPEIEKCVISGGTSLPGAYRYYLQGLGLLQDERNKENINLSIDMFTEAINQDSSYDEAHAALGKAYLLMFGLSKEQNWLEKASFMCNRALQLNKGIYQVHITLGDIQKAKGAADQAIKEYQKALSINPYCFRARHKIAYTLYFNLAQRNRAEEEWKKAVQLRPEYWEGYEWLAYFYYQGSRHPEAEKQLLKMIELSPANKWAYSTLIAIYNDMGDNNSLIKAVDVFNKSTKFKPDSITYTNVGNTYYMQKKYEMAKNMYVKAVEMAGTDPNVHNFWGNLADCYHIIGGHDQEAQDAYQKAVKLVQEKLMKKPDDAHLRSSLALYLSKSGESKEAIQQIEGALKRDPNRLEVIRNSIMVYEISDQRDQALLWLKEYIKRQGALGMISGSPFLTRLHKDQRYLKLVKPSKSAKK